MDGISGEESCSTQNSKAEEVEKSANKKKKKPKEFDMPSDVTEENMEVSEDISPEAYIPGRSRPLMEDEQLVMDKSSYRLFYDLQLEYASLSFDILLDNLGSGREVEVNGSEISASLLAGTQAAPGMGDALVVLRMSNMKPFQRKVHPEDDSADKSDDSDESSSSDEDLDSQPELEAAKIRHRGTVNRVRAFQYGGRYLAASWSEEAKVFIWDLTRPLTAVNDSAVMSEYVRFNETPVPLFTNKRHKSEGFALDWSPHPLASGHLASGDCDGVIYHWVPQPTGWSLGKKAYTGHTGSVEDIQWSITEPTVFISVSSDRSIRVWDTRSPPNAGSMLTVPDAHTADVNVLSWNRLQSTSLLTGGDDGALRVWDLRLVHKRYAPGGKPNKIPAYTHVYDYHTKPITSVEWHPNDAGVFVATSEDDQVTIWDTTLEQADQPMDDALAKGDETANLPVQLLFIHCGQTEIKEAHWHPQIPGLLVVTSIDGFNVFRTCNV
ncbi:hypothetical protein T265_10945 [Opisthorchis viverrini]|uniref:Glutamate-rich WD repeat-containing protein 1 n=2 Tax=Opisthorchis viverrini TaxID=6198 RepID=A0A074ZZA9_OPIVI|nr:hypothetical protein T265_10945 [Opisthorchis viverrini]KER20514.1 hypothetical protein T265_10945 [Opisthorchis viverrini]